MTMFNYKSLNRHISKDIVDKQLQINGSTHLIHTGPGRVSNFTESHIKYGRLKITYKFRPPINLLQPNSGILVHFFLGHLLTNVS